MYMKKKEDMDSGQEYRCWGAVVEEGDGIKEGVVRVVLLRR